MATVYGTNSSDIINGDDGVTHGDDLIYGYGGNDTIYGLNGNDFISGGAGNDTIYGGANNDTMDGGDGADSINGGSGTDLVHYLNSDEGVIVSLLAGEGADGDAEGDTLTGIENLGGSAFDDLLIGNDGNNIIWGHIGNDIINGGNGNDVLYGESGNDTLKGGGGDDNLFGGAGADEIDGESGIDTAAYYGSSAGVSVSLATGLGYGGDAEGDTLVRVENLSGSAHNDWLIGDGGSNRLSGNHGHDILDGGNGADILFGDAGNDTLKGGGGSDSLYGQSGDDTLYGGAGTDIMFGDMYGDPGNDTYYVDNAGDMVVDTSAATFDQVYTSASYTLTAGANIELMETTDDSGTSAIKLTGNDASQEIQGNNGANVINGRFGNDLLVGFGGEDVFQFSSMLDAASNVDTISDFNQADDFIALDNAIFTGLATEEGHYLIGAEFHIGSAAAEADDRIIYDASTGALYYDSDGTGAADQVQFATLSAGMALVNDDFIVV